MKRLLALLIIGVLIITGVAPVHAADTTVISAMDADFVSGLTGLSDPNLHRYVEDSLYTSLVSELNSDSYFVENVEAVYISQEYLDELAYNSQANIFFGYTLAELEAEFQSAKFIFTLGEDGKTVVEPFQNYDDTYDKVLKNIAIGTGVILICVTVSVVTGGLGAPAVSVIFAASAKTSAIMALSGGALGAASAGIITGIQTNDMDSALKAAALAGSEGFKWGAITGAISGGALQAIKLKGATLSGLKMNDAAIIQRETGYPVEVIKQFSSMEQYEIFKQAGLSAKIINGKTSLIRHIDLDYIGKGEYALSNRDRMKQGWAAFDSITGKTYDLHHVGQRMDSSLAILTEAEHVQYGNFRILHPIPGPSLINRPVFDAERVNFWKSLVEIIETGVI